MKLNNKDKEELKSMGYSDENVCQIEEAITKTVYEMNGKKISAKKALEVLGRDEYLSGISRSAFHWSAVRNNKEGEKVYFDSSKLFK